MKVQLILYLILTGIQLLGQNSDLNILTESKALNILDKEGFERLEEFTQPINLVFLNSANSKIIIDKEFSTGFIKPHHDSVGIFVFDLPKYTIEVAKSFKNEYAAQKLFNYYKSLPKQIKSDTIYNAYFSLSRLLSLFLFYNSEGLEETLKRDYYEWINLAEITYPKKYLSVVEYKQELVSIPFEESLEFKEEDLTIDCNFVAFQIAVALNMLGNEEFDNVFIKQLKQKQSYTFINNYRFPKFYNYNLEERLNDINKQNIIELNFNCPTIDVLAKQPELLERILHEKVENCCDSRLIEILHNDKHNAYVEFSRNNGYDAYIIKLENDKLFIQEVWSIIE